VSRWLLVMVTSAAMPLVNILPSRANQDVSIGAVPGMRDYYLAFSKDGRLVREVGSVESEGTGPQTPHVRAVTYAAANGEIRRVWNLPSDTWYLSSTTDGRMAVISVDRDPFEKGARLILFDTETGRTQQIPSSWFDVADKNPYAQISGDGRFVSAYRNRDGGRSVTVYNWRTGKLVFKRTEGYPAGGIDSGGVTVDGKITFRNNRSGGDVVDPKTGRVLVTFAPNTRRSPDGAWVAEFPNTLYGDTPREVIIENGRSGEAVSKLDLQIADDTALEAWAWAPSAFCGTSGRFIAAANDTVQAFQIPSGKMIADFPKTTWQDPLAPNTHPLVTLACSFNGKLAAIRPGGRLTPHDLN
jgi:hypothetical protein